VEILKIWLHFSFWGTTSKSVYSQERLYGHVRYLNGWKRPIIKWSVNRTAVCLADGRYSYRTNFVHSCNLMSRLTDDCVSVNRWPVVHKAKVSVNWVSFNWVSFNWVSINWMSANQIPNSSFVFSEMDNWFCCCWPGADQCLTRDQGVVMTLMHILHRSGIGPTGSPKFWDSTMLSFQAATSGCNLDSNKTQVLTIFLD
jgi:hypothetical protein